jgi:hypothetical protein
VAPSAPVLVLLSLLALPATSTAASPRTPVPFHVELSAPAGCTSVEAVVRSVETRVGPARRARPGEGGPHFKLRISQTGARVRGVLSVVGERGETDDRTVEGASCDEIVEALSLTMALSLATDAKQPPPAPRGSDRSPSSPRSRSAAAPRATAPASAPAAPTPNPPPAAVPTPPPVPEPPPPVSPPSTPPPPEVVERAAPPPPPPPAQPPADAIQAPAEPEEPGRPAALAIGVAAIVAQPVSPPLSVGGLLSLGLAWPNADVSSLGRAPTRLDLGVIHAANDYLQSPRGLVARWTAVALGACPPLGLGGRIELQPCGRATAGWLSASVPAIANPTPVGRWWFSLGALLRLSVPIGGGFALEASGGVEFPLVERRFMTIFPVTPVGQTPRAAGWGGLGLARSL